MMWDWQYCISIIPDLLKGLEITIVATFLGFTLACVLGLPLLIARRSSYRILSLTMEAFTEFVRSTPFLAQLYFIFYVLPNFGLVMSPLLAGVLGLGVHYSTYLSEVYRSGLEAIPRGQWEAAAALNFSRRDTWLKIILPQAIPPMVPVMGNYLIAMFKDTPVLSAITLTEILLTAKVLGSRSFRYLEPITMVGIAFLVLSCASALAIEYLEKRMKRVRPIQLGP